ncbi:protein of unknown function [Pararobbsia alpina]
MTGQKLRCNHPGTPAGPGLPASFAGKAKTARGARFQPAISRASLPLIDLDRTGVASASTTSPA